MGWKRRGTVTAGVLGVVLGALALVTPAANAAAAHAAATAQAAPQGLFSTTCSADFDGGDFRLGPAQLPNVGRVGFQLLGYRRTGGMPDSAFLAKYWDATANSWIYPPDNGFLIVAGQPVEFTQTMVPGTDIDRYGSEYGGFLAPEGSPYTTRAIPPSSLDGTPAAGCNYHDYQVLKPFAVHSGPIAPWFGQTGLGLQYQLDGTLIPGAPASVNVMWLLDNGYLRRLV
jgi:hypothetical protein